MHARVYEEFEARVSCLFRHTMRGSRLVVWLVVWLTVKRRSGTKLFFLCASTSVCDDRHVVKIPDVA